MAETIKFELSGKTAFFRNPEVNKNCYFTYEQIHKIAVLGILGAIIGLNGYSAQDNNEDYPEFYEKLRNFKISIVPKTERGYFSKKIQKYNNSTGLASSERGGNLVETEQWLQDVKWDIYILKNETPEYNKIKEYLLNSKCEYIPYLGRTDHYANIKNVKVLDMELSKTPECINSLFIYLKEYMKFGADYTPYNDDDIPYIYCEYLPIELDKDNMYKNALFYYTNSYIEFNKQYNNIYSLDGCNYMFF